MNLQITPFAISGFLIVLTYLPLFFFIILKGKTKLARIYAFHIFAVFIWGLGSLLLGINTEIKYAPLISQYSYIGVLFIPVFFQHAVQIITNKRNPIYLFLIYGQAIFFIISIF